MTGGRRPARNEAIDAYKEYVRPVIMNPLDDRKLTVRGLREQSGLGNDTIYKYGLNKRVQRIERWRERRRGNDAGRKGSKRYVQLQRALEERDEYRMKYEALLEKWLTLKYILQDHRDLDVEELVAKYPLSKPLRQVAPQTTRSKIRRS